MRTTLNLDQFVFVHWQMKTSFSITIMWSCTSEKNLHWSMKARKYFTYVRHWWACQLSSDGSRLFAEPMFLFGWALCNTSVYCILTFWLSWVNYVLRGEFPLLYILLQDIFTYALFLLPGVNLSLKNQLPYYIIYSVFLKQTFAGTKFLRDECSVNLYNFFCEGNNTFP